jgi:TetR/AcrR family transcriptional regulator, cholesterol catabolism regulator
MKKEQEITNSRAVTKEVVAQVANRKLVARRHEQIVHAACELFSKKGYHPTTMREISTSSGINLSYLYKYVSSKDDILYLFYEHLHKQWTPIYSSLEDKNSDPLDQLKDFIRSMLEVIHKFKDEMKTMYSESRHLERDSLHAVLSTESGMIKSIEKVIIRGVKKGRFKTKDPFFAANIIQYLLVIEALRGWNLKDQYTFNRIVEMLEDFVLSALRVEFRESHCEKGEVPLP